MSRIKLTKKHVEAALLGGCFLGGGGGGSRANGRALGEAALKAGALELVSIDEIDPDSTVVTCSAVGAPAAKTAMSTPKSTVRVLELLKGLGVPAPAGLISNENGGGSTFNGWLPAAMSGLPLIDAPCNGRAHPTGTMGAMGLQRDKNYISYQAAAGGNPQTGHYLEASFRGSIEGVSALVRQCAVQAGGSVSVARNPVKASYAEKNGAPGGISLAIEVGMKMLESKASGVEASVLAAVNHLGGKLLTSGEVNSIQLVTQGGFDSGIVAIDNFELTFWNEFMTLDRGGKRVGTFPDLITTVDCSTGVPVTSAELKKGQHVYVILVPADNLPLGKGVFCKELMEPIEQIINKPVLPYITLK